jgi:hypothetical protein
MDLGVVAGGWLIVGYERPIAALTYSDQTTQTGNSLSVRVRAARSGCHFQGLSDRVGESPRVVRRLQTADWGLPGKRDGSSDSAAKSLRRWVSWVGRL